MMLSPPLRKHALAPVCRNSSTAALPAQAASPPAAATAGMSAVPICEHDACMQPPSVIKHARTPVRQFVANSASMTRAPFGWLPWLLRDHKQHCNLPRNNVTGQCSVNDLPATVTTTSTAAQRALQWASRAAHRSLVTCGQARPALKPAHVTCDVHALMHHARRSFAWQLSGYMERCNAPSSEPRARRAGCGRAAC